MLLTPAPESSRDLKENHIFLVIKAAAATSKCSVEIGVGDGEYVYTVMGGRSSQDFFFE